MNHRTDKRPTVQRRQLGDSSPELVILTGRGIRGFYIYLECFLDKHPNVPTKYKPYVYPHSKNTPAGPPRNSSFELVGNRFKTQKSQLIKSGFTYIKSEYYLRFFAISCNAVWRFISSVAVCKSNEQYH